MSRAREAGFRATYGRLLRNRPLRRLLAGEFISSLGDAMYLVAFVVVIYRETHDPILLGAVAAARQLPFALLSIPAGALVDRFDRRVVLLVTDVLKGLAMLGLASLVAGGAPIAPIAALAVGSAILSTAFWPAIWAYIPGLVEDERDLGPANSALATLDNVAWILGPILAGVILAVGDASVPFLINAITFALMAVVLWTLPTASARQSQPEPGLRLELAPLPPGIDRRALAGLVVLAVVTAFAVAGVNILIVVLVVDVFRAGDGVTGFLNAAVGLGGTFGAILSGVVVLRPRFGRSLLVAGFGMAAAAAALGVANSAPLAFVAITAMSAGNLVLEVIRTTVLQRLVPDSHIGRFSGLLLTAAMGAEVVGTVLVPAAVPVLSIAWVFVLIAGAIAFGASLAIWLIRGAGDNFGRKWPVLASSAQPQFPAQERQA
ncbi:MAG: MFS transporter [Chloroflexota bacterium]